MTDEELAALVPDIHDRWAQTPEDKIARNLAYQAVRLLPALVEEVQRLRSVVAALVESDANERVVGPQSYGGATVHFGPPPEPQVRFIPVPVDPRTGRPIRR